MKGKTHGIVGITCFVYLCSLLPGKLNITNFIFTILGSMIPDIDHPKSFINKYVLPSRNKVSKVCMFFSLGVLVLYIDTFYASSVILKIIGISLILIALSNHRMGFTHSIFGLIIFNIIIGFFAKGYNSKEPNIFFTMGFLLHLVCDMFTKQGIPIFYPLSNKKYKFFITYRSGKSFGNFLEKLIIIFSIGYILFKLPIFFR